VPNYAPHAKGYSGEDLTSPEAILAHNQTVHELSEICRTYEGYVNVMQRHTAIQIGAATVLPRMDWVAWCKTRDKEAGVL